MKTTVSEYDFTDAFRAYGRQDQFSYEAQKLLFAFLEEMEQDTGEETELDVIALCCDFYESDADEIISNFSLDIDGLDDDEKTDLVRDYLQENTMFVGETSQGSFIYQAF